MDLLVQLRILFCSTLLKRLEAIFLLLLIRSVFPSPSLPFSLISNSIFLSFIIILLKIQAGEKVGKDFALCQDEDEPLPSIDDPFRLKELMRDRLLRDEKQSGKLDGFVIYFIF